MGIDQAPKAPITPEEEYFRTYGTFAPEPTGSDSSSVRVQIEALLGLANRTTDQEEAQRLLHEASYLNDKLVREGYGD